MRETDTGLSSGWSVRRNAGRAMRLFQGEGEGPPARAQTPCLHLQTGVHRATELRALS